MPLCDTQRVPWVLDSLTIGWPPQVKLKRLPGDEEALHQLFIFLEDKTLLLDGYGPQAGIVTPGELSDRVDLIRAQLLIALQALRPEAPVAEWLRKLQEAAHELNKKANLARFDESATPEPAEIAPAVNQLRDAFAYVAEHVSDVYRLRAAGNLADLIRKDIQ